MGVRLHGQHGTTISTQLHAAVLHHPHCSRKCHDGLVRSQQPVEKSRYHQAVLARPQACPGPMPKAKGSSGFALHLSSWRAPDVSHRIAFGVALNSSSKSNHAEVKPSEACMLHKAHFTQPEYRPHYRQRPPRPLGSACISVRSMSSMCRTTSPLSHGGSLNVPSVMLKPSLSSL